MVQQARQCTWGLHLLECLVRALAALLTPASFLLTFLREAAGDGSSMRAPATDTETRIELLGSGFGLARSWALQTFRE